MADSVEDKGSLTERLEEDRQKMAVQVSELKKNYNVADRLRASVRKYPWTWITGAVLTGFLFSRLSARRKEVYLSPDSLRSGSSREVHSSRPDKDDSRTTNKLWSLAKPIISTYIGRELYNRVRRPSTHAADRSRNGRDRR